MLLAITLRSKNDHRSGVLGIFYPPIIQRMPYTCQRHSFSMDQIVCTTKVRYQVILLLLDFCTTTFVIHENENSKATNFSSI